MTVLECRRVTVLEGDRVLHGRKLGNLQSGTRVAGW